MNHTPLYTLTVHNCTMGTFLLIHVFCLYVPFLLTISKIDRPSTKMARPVRAWLCRTDWLCRDTPRGSAWKRSVEFSQMFWTAKLKQKNQIEQTKRLNHQDTKHEASCHGRFLLDAIKVIPQVLWEQLRTLINWQWSSFHALVGFFMWQIRSSWVLFFSMVWSVLVVILCISCMTTTMELATFERGQEQSHLVIMKHPDTAFWGQPCCWEMAMICFWLQMVLFCAMMTFLADILRSLVSSHTWDIILQIEPLDMAYHLRSRLALGATTWQSEKSTRNTCHQARYPSTWKMTRLLSGEFPIHLFQREEQQRGNSWAKKFLRGTWSCSTTFQMTEENQKLVMICRMDYQAH